MQGRQGCHAGNNGQIVTDGQQGLIEKADVVNDNNDRKQFAEHIQAACEDLPPRVNEMAGAEISS